MQIMKNMQVIIWFLPIIFIFHDFEEIIFMKAWINKNNNYLSRRFPKLSQKLLPHFKNITTSSFALGVAEEFVLITAVTIVSYAVNSYNFWIGIFIVFTLHLIMHIFQAVIVKKYVPAVVTSIICLPLCIYILMMTITLFKINTIIFYSILSLIIAAINLYLIHKGMDIFTAWLSKYETNERTDK